MNILRIIGLIVLLVFVIFIPSIVLFLIADFIYTVPATFILFVAFVVIVTIMGLIGWAITSILNRVTGSSTTWPRTLVLCFISVLSSWLVALVLAKIGYLIIFELALPRIFGPIIMIVALILAALSTGFAIKQVTNLANRNWAIGMILIFTTFYLIQGSIHFFRNDFYDTRTGEPKIAASFYEEGDKKGQIKKIFYNLPRNTRFDPETGDRIIEKISKTQIKNYLSNRHLEKNPPPPPPSTQSARIFSGKILEAEIAPNSIYEIDRVRYGQSWKYLTYSGEFSHRINKGDGLACWRTVDRSEPWQAEWPGSLEIKTGDNLVKLKVNLF